jgi:hypothetical protein
MNCRIVARTSTPRLMENRLLSPDEVYLASFPFGDSAAMKLRPVLLLTRPMGAIPETVSP